MKKNDKTNIMRILDGKKAAKATGEKSISMIKQKEFISE